MQAPAVVLVSLLVATTAAVGTSLLLRPEAGIAPSTVGLEAQIADLQQQVAALQEAATAARRSEAAAVASPASVSRSAVPLVSEQAIAAAVEAYMKKQQEALSGVPGAPAEFDLDKEFGKLAEVSYWQDPELWKRAFAAGRMDEVLAKFEALAKADPNSTAAHLNLARAYMAYLQMDQSKWQLSMKADKAYDRVLALDDHHWEARFTKAVSYTFWPDFLGKKKAAIENFEVLVDQQELQPPTDQQAQTYLYLGNLLEQSDPARARTIWQRGLARHPNDSALRDKLGR